MLAIPWWQIGYAAARGLLALVCNPLLYIACACMAWDLHRHSWLERRLFGIRVTKAWRNVGWLWLQGLGAGVLLSVLCAVAGIVVDKPTAWVVSGLSLVFGLLRPRWSATVCSIGFIVLVGVLVQCLPMTWANSVLTEAPWLQHIPVAGWLGLGSLLCFVEALFVWLNRKRFASPLLVMSKRGRTMGGYVARLTYIAPCLALTDGGTVQTAHLSWLPAAWPWLAGSHAAFGLFGFPVVFGFSALYATMKPHEGMNTVAACACLSGLLVGGAAYAAHRYTLWWAVAGALLLWAGRAAAMLITRSRETRSEPLYITSPLGVKVLAVLRASVASAMGIRPGELITHVNQVPVHTAYDFHFAMDQNPAYARLQVLDERGVPRIVGRPVYAGARVKLGIVLVPDLPNHPACSAPAPGLLQTLWLRMAPSGSGRVSDALPDAVPPNGT
ncbi:MAG: PDZ domain-containing protein [Alicyclobacillus sp.]|nr:PDZ domain-containing protein [Alicyclobacillus sp.]